MRSMTDAMRAHRDSVFYILVVMAAAVSVHLMTTATTPQAHARESLGEAVVAEPKPLDEYRNCDGTTSTYTPESTTGEGESSGHPTINEAMQNACWDALYKAAKDQFSCKTCEGEEDPCDKIDGGADSAGAVVTDPVNDCSKDPVTGLWGCDGEVTFQVPGAPTPTADAGCEDCDE